MLKNYFITAWRSFWDNKVFSAINILGLSTGLACCILIFLFIQDELSYDKFHKNADNIYRVTSDAQGPSGKTHLAVTPAPWAPLMKKEFPEIKNYTRLLKAEKTDMGQPGEKHFYESGLLYADSTFPDVFSVILEKGNAKKALEEPNSIILTNEAAKKYFGDEDPIGKALEVNSFMGRVTVKVTAVAKGLPSNSHFSFSCLISLPTLGDVSNFWAYHMFQTYLLLNDNSVAGMLEKKFPEFVNRYINGNPLADGMQEIHLQPLTSIHLHSNMIGELGANSDITYIYVFAAVAIFLLLIACFNFMNLSTARSLTRAKEVGLRKVVGAGRKQLLGQFLGETILFAVISLLLAIAIAYLVLPVFNQLSQRALQIDFTRNYALIILSIFLLIAVGLVAGLYPAVILSAFKPVEILKGKFTLSGKGISFRKALVTSQFAVSIILIASTILVNRQLNFLQTKRIGFDKENVMLLSLPKDIDSVKLFSFKASLLNEPSVLSVAGSSSVPGVVIPINQVNDGNADLSKALPAQMLFTDLDFVRTMKMKLLAGRDFSADYPTDKTEGFIINQEEVKKMGWKSPADAIGKTIQWVRPGTVIKKGIVVGVVEDFNMNPLRMAIQPLVIHYTALRLQYLYVRFNQNNAASVTGIIEKKFNEFYPKQSFEYTFLDDNLRAMYSSEKRLATIFTYFSCLAILIACLGVLGLSLYSIQQRIREIGIRKVLGASVMSITGELLKEFIKPVFIAAIVATPVAWYMMHKWLEDFAYRTNISSWIFIVAGVLAGSIAVLTISIQAIKAAIANPIKSLRTE